MGLGELIAGEKGLTITYRCPRLVVERAQGLVPDYSRRFTVQPGLTGLAQVADRGGDEAECLVKRVHYDLYYIENWSVRLDLKIIWLTVLRGFFHKHAY